jgi:predicted HNH restriction endonuclease
MINFNEFKNYVKTINGRVLQTLQQKKKFIVQITNGEILYIPQTTAKPRLHEDLYLKRVIDRFNKTKSFKPKDYVDITRNASYTLALIKQFMTKRNNKYTSDDYADAFRQLNIAQYHMRMLQAHYYAPDRTLTATQMSKAMGYLHFKAANLHYGRLGRLVGEKLGYYPLPKQTVNVLVEFEKPGKEWLWIMRPEVAQALETLGWTNDTRSDIPEEVENSVQLYEGTVRTISVNAYERSAVARENCILYYGCKCAVCEVTLSDIYGDIAQGYIHVHHLRQLSEINYEYQVDPIQDLLPVCPNCHAILHQSQPPYSIEEVKGFINEQKKSYPNISLNSNEWKLPSDH